jgi:uncharacterized alkaline shock family protein YloU
MKLTKNGQVNRLCVVFYALISLVAALLACVYLPRIFNQMGWYSSLFYVFNQQPVLWVLPIIAVAIYCAWSIYLIISALARKPRIDKSSVSLQSSETGSVRVSISALDTLVKEAVNNIKGVGEIKTYIINHEDSITVDIEMELLSDEHIPNVTMLMQRDIKSFIEEYSGIAVREVSIMVLAIKIPDEPYHEERERRNFLHYERVSPRQDDALIESSPAVSAVSLEGDLPEAKAYEPEFEIEVADGSVDEPAEGSETEPEAEAEFDLDET